MAHVGSFHKIQNAYKICQSIHIPNAWRRIVRSWKKNRSLHSSDAQYEVSARTSAVWSARGSHRQNFCKWVIGIISLTSGRFLIRNQLKRWWIWDMIPVDPMSISFTYRYYFVFDPGTNPAHSLRVSWFTHSGIGF